MSRQSSDVLSKDGTIYDGFDYNLQVWVEEGIVQPCGHIAPIATECCNSRKYAGKMITTIPGHEVRP